MRKNTVITKGKKLQIAIVVVSVICTLVLTFAWFSNRLRTIISDTNNSFLKETSSHQAALFNTKLQDQLSVLESLAKQFSNVDFSNYRELKDAVFSLHGVGDFRQMTVADSSGACLSNNNTYAANISRKHYFQSALKGIPTVSNGIDVDVSGEDILALSVPIYQDNAIVGVLTGIYDRSVLDSLFSTTMFNGEGYTYIINSSGDIMVKTDNVHALAKDSNYLDYLAHTDILNGNTYKDVVEDLSRTSSGTLHYKSGSQERFVSYYPVGLHDWYVVSEITDQVIITQTQDLSFIIIILMSILAVILFGAFIIAFSTMQKSEAAIIRNERFTLVNAQNQSVIFDYDIHSHVLDLSGTTDFIFGESYPVNGPLDLPLLTKHVHPDDLAAFRQFVHACAHGKAYHSFEFRYLCNDNSYYWFRLSSTIVKNASNPVKIVGNVVNVESQKAQELTLKEKAEHDQLTGLFNKTAMKGYTEAFLKTQDPSAIHALFIIDLDNFKSVNDTLGHVFGDKVLVDTAARLSRVFSEKDIIGRIGGDEFCAFLNLSAFDNIESAHRIIIQKAESLKKSMHETYSGAGNKEVTVSTSIGIALYQQDGSDYMTLYNNADKALYASKKYGKNTYTFYQNQI